MFWILMATVFATIAWGVYCDGRTSNQRGELIEAIFMGRGAWKPFSRLYDQVSYNQHAWALFIGRDPLKLYPPELRTRLHRYRITQKRRALEHV